tara:strand:+ start:575 stop:2155 length:1581 start_codon:yes stop_codon:yes gene_type:complete
VANTKVTSRVLADNAVLTANINDDAVTTAKIADDVALGGNPTTTTQSAGNNTTRIATTAFVTTAVANIVDSAPSALDTLNELAAALGDDANFSTTVTNSIATKAPLSAPTFTGDVDIDATDDLRLRFLRGSTFKGGIQVPTSTGDMISGSAVDDLAIRSQGNILFSSGGNTEHMRIASGKVGIGTDNPATTLDIRTSNGSDAKLRLGSSSSIGLDVLGTIEFFSADPDDSGIKSSIHNLSTGNQGPGGSLSGNLIFSTTASDGGGNDSPTEAMRIDSSQNVTTTGHLKAKGQLITQGTRSSGRGEIHINGSGVDDVAEIFFGYGDGYTSGDGNIRWGISDRGYSNGHLIFYEGPKNSGAGFTEVASFTQTDGAFKVVNGIRFGSDTAAANTLDDYEEGTWSASLRGTSGQAGAHAQSTVSAHYRKVGGLCFINAHFYLTNKGSYGGSTTLVGLPFTNTGSTGQISLGSFPDSGYGTTSGNVLIAASILSGGAEVRFYEGARLDGSHSYSDVGTGYYVNIGGCYPVD